MLTPKEDYADAAVGRLPTQFRNKPRMEALVRGLMEAAQTCEAGLLTLETGRRIATATGEALDVLGRIVGEERVGLTDEPFRLRIQARVATNKSSGTGDEVLRIFALLTDLPLTLREEFPAAFVVRVGGGALEYPEVYADILQRAKPAGVRALLEWLNAAPAESFSFAGGEGLGFLRMVTTIGEREDTGTESTSASGPFLVQTGPLAGVTGALRVRITNTDAVSADAATYEYSCDDGATWLTGANTFGTATIESPHPITNFTLPDPPDSGLGLYVDPADTGAYTGNEVYRWELLSAGTGGVFASVAHRPRG